MAYVYRKTRILPINGLSPHAAVSSVHKSVPWRSLEMRGNLKIVFFLIVLGLAFSITAPSKAAHLVKTDETITQKTTKNGQPVIQDEDVSAIIQSSRAAPSEIIVIVSFIATATPDINNPEATGASAASSGSSYLIEPDEGEKDGDCVPVQYTYAGDVKVEQMGTPAASEAGLGGPVVTVSALASSDSQSATALVTFDRGAWIMINSGPPAFSYGPDVTSTDGATLVPERQGQFIARIGDTLSFAIAAGAASAAAYPASFAGAQAGAYLEIALEPTECPPIPSVNPWGAGVLFFLMAVSALLLMKRKQSA